MRPAISFDIEFVVDSKSQDLKPLEDARDVGADIHFGNRGVDRVAVRTPRSEADGGTLGEALDSFLTDLRDQALLEHLSGAQLRVGCFVEIKQVACWFIDLSPSLLSQISSLGSELEVSLYHCWPDSPDTTESELKEA